MAVNVQKARRQVHAARIEHLCGGGVREAAHGGDLSSLYSKVAPFGGRTRPIHEHGVSDQIIKHHIASFLWIF